MKILFYTSVFIFIGCRPGNQKIPVKETGSSTDPLTGAWELVHALYGLPEDTFEISQSDNPIQLKLFTDGHYAHVMHGGDGNFLGASAGSYTIDGDHYIERTHWSSNPEGIGTVTTFVFKVEGDSLLISGPIELIDANGNLVTDFKQMKELRLRAKN